jgi:hypothetical protein
MTDTKTHFDSVWNPIAGHATTTDDARAVTEQMRIAFREMRAGGRGEDDKETEDLMAQAYETGAWSALGYGTWEEYLSGEFPCTCDCHGEEA